MISRATTSLSAETRHLKQAAIAVFILLELAGLYWASSPEAVLGYTLITLTVFLPCVIWVRAGMPGIPVWPAVALMSWLYYALPILRNRQDKVAYNPAEVLYLAVTVSGYLLVATVPWWMMLEKAHKTRRQAAARVPSSQMIKVIFFGFGTGVLYYILVYVGALSALGPFFGFVRSAMTTGALVSCYLLGYSRGRGFLQGKLWAMGLAALAGNVLITWNSLFLIGGMTYILAVTAGYVITTRRFPWLPLLATGLLVAVLHAGKAEMRSRYWLGTSNSNASAAETMVRAPEFFADWLVAGVNELLEGGNRESLVDRASLFGLLMKVEQLAPGYISFLDGETYAFLPLMLVPRFIVPDKITSQEGMMALNIHFGFQSAEDAQSTAVGWGLIAEGYANFGFEGVIGIGLVTGLLAGAFNRWSCNADALSSATLTGIVALMNLVNLEADFSNLITNLFQACASVIMLNALWKWLGIRRSGALVPHGVARLESGLSRSSDPSGALEESGSAA